MGYKIRTNLKSTNMTLISYGSTFFKEVTSMQSEYIGCDNDEIKYLTHNNDLHEELIKLSSDYPDECFTSTKWIDDVDPGILIFTNTYKNGECETVSKKPMRVTYHPANISIDEQLLNSFRNHVYNYFDHIDEHKDSDDFYKEFTTIIWENDDQRFSAEETGRGILLNYERKEPILSNTEIKSLISQVDVLKKSQCENDKKDDQDTDEDYDDLPF